jgi:hypothetical protein
VRDGFARILENLFEDPVLEEGTGVEAGATGNASRFAACLAGRNELDGAAALLLASLLRAHGHRAYVFGPDLSAVPGGSEVALRDAAAVCLPLISTSSPARARYIIRRVRRRAPRAYIVAGFGGSVSPILCRPTRWQSLRPMSSRPRWLRQSPLSNHEFLQAFP